MIYTGRHNTFKCKDCVERTPGCHDHCEKYDEGKAKYENLKNAVEGDREVRAYAKKQVLRNTMPHKYGASMVRPKNK